MPFGRDMHLSVRFSGGACYRPTQGDGDKTKPLFKTFCHAHRAFHAQSAFHKTRKELISLRVRGLRTRHGGEYQMKIAIIGYSGSGKSTLASKLGQVYGCEVLHLDSIHFSAGWVERTDEEMKRDVEAFLEKDGWVIDGNYSRIFFWERMETADQIIILNFNRFTCIKRAYRRYRTFSHKTRPDMAEGCEEKFDWAFFRWLLWDGRKKKVRDRHKKILQIYKEKTVVLKNQRDIDRLLSTLLTKR